MELWRFGIPQIHMDIKTLEHLTYNSSSQINTNSVTNPVDVNPGPIAAFTHDTYVGTPTTFQDLTTTVPPLGGALDNWLWEFGDGNTSTNQNPTHQLMQGYI